MFDSASRMVHQMWEYGVTLIVGSVIVWVLFRWADDEIGSDDDDVSP